jgi:predicted DNA-binding transcriptional regulator AlpA
MDGKIVSLAGRRHRFDRVADKLAEKLEAEGGADDLLDTEALAKWLGRSKQWLELGRSKNYGPAYVRLSGRCVRYRRSDVIRWLAERTHQSAAEYRRESGTANWGRPRKAPRVPLQRGPSAS